MDLQAVLDLYDRAERVEVRFPDMQRQVTTHVIRHVSLRDETGFISYSWVDEDTVEDAIREQIYHFEGLSIGFEWKVYEHDSPSDLKERLERYGFRADEPEAIMVLQVASAPTVLLAPVTHDVRRIEDPALIPQILKVQEEVWEERKDGLAKRLQWHLRHHPNLMTIYAAYAGRQPVCSAWLFHDTRSPFGSLWGGATVPAYRGQGFYTALVAARVQEASRRGARFLTVDASSMSRPILERLGFQRITTAYARRWKQDD